MLACVIFILALVLMRSTLHSILPMHRAGLVSTVGNVVEEVAHAGVLCALLSRAVVVVHHLVNDIVRDATSTVWNPLKQDKIKFDSFEASPQNCSDEGLVTIY